MARHVTIVGRSTGTASDSQSGVEDQATRSAVGAAPATAPVVTALSSSTVSRSSSPPAAVGSDLAVADSVGLVHVRSGPLPSALVRPDSPGEVLAPPLAPASPPGAFSPGNGPRRRRRRRTPWPIPILAVVSMSVGLVVQIGRPLPRASLALVRSAPITVSGTAPALPWPTSGQAAVAVPAAGVLVSPSAETPVPIASLTKMMTALVILRDHPLGVSAPGPSIVMSAADQENSAADSANDDTFVPVTAGESLTERQLLDGLLVHSANDFAYALALWDAGSVPAFVAKMNATAASLGMRQTTYVDSNGLDAGDVSTPVDQLKLAEVAMTVPIFAAVVAQPTITEPGAGELSNYVPVVGTQGVVGVKSGFTQAAMGCLVLAADRQVGGRQVLMLAALTGQQGFDPLGTADTGALALVDAATGGLRWQTLVSAGRRQGSLAASWTGRRSTMVTGASVTALVWPGTRWSSTLTPRSLPTSVAAGRTVATLTLSNGSIRLSVPVRTTRAVPPPSMGWRLIHG